MSDKTYKHVTQAYANAVKWSMTAKIFTSLSKFGAHFVKNSMLINSNR